ncbi:MAG: hypothetical protein ABWY30_06025, partial [Microterricola sp.]
GVGVSVSLAGAVGAALGVGETVAAGDAEGVSVEANAGAVAPPTAQSNSALATAKAAVREVRGSMEPNREKGGQCCPTVRMRAPERQRPFGGGALGQNGGMKTEAGAR